MNKYEFTRTFEIGPLMVDFNQRLFPAELFRMLQITADAHVNTLGYDNATMSSMGYGWVLIRSDVKIDEYPRYRDTIEIYTATCETKHGIYPRYFEIRDSKGVLLGTAITMWVVFSLEKRQMVSEKDCGISIPAGIDPAKSPVLPRAPKLLKEGLALGSKRTVVYSDLDMIGHMNNTHYIDWLCDAVPVQKYRECEMTHILIGYAEETQAGTELELEYRENGDAFSFGDLTAPKSHFTIQGEWKRI